MKPGRVRVIGLWMSVGAALSAVPGCAGNGVGLDDQGNPRDSTAQQADTLSFSARVQPIFSANCALSGCHAGTQPAQGMNLSAGLAYQNIVNVPANERPGMMRVLPLKPDSSYLVHKIQGTQATVGGSGDRMPLGGTPLSAEQITLIRAWIAAGAKNN